MTDDWRADALCAQTDPDAFFPEGQGQGSRAAKRVCGRCEVVDQCREYALVTAQTEGVWGGMTARELRRLRVERGLPSAQELAVMERRDAIRRRLAAGAEVAAIAVELEVTTATVLRVQRKFAAERRSA